MTARDDNPKIHRIEVERDVDGEIEGIRFVCDGGPDAPCHHWPDCDCEGWDDNHYVTDENGVVIEPRKPLPGHEDVQQNECWIDPWFNEALGYGEIDWIEAWDGEGDEPSFDELHSGPVSVTFEGDYMTWEYAEVTP